MAKQKDGGDSGEFRMGELTAAVAALTVSVASIHSTVDTILKRMDEGNSKFKDLEHADGLIDIRIKAIEALQHQAASTKQSILMMLLDKGIGVLLPWSAVAYMLYGKTP